MIVARAMSSIQRGTLLTFLDKVTSMFLQNFSPTTHAQSALRVDGLTDSFQHRRVIRAVVSQATPTSTGAIPVT